MPGWDTTDNEYRYRLRAPGDFVRIRPKPFKGIRGVYLVGGPLKAGAPGHAKHGKAWVAQAIRFKRADWTLEAAKAWVAEHGGRLENPGIVDAIRPGDRVTIVDRFGKEHTGRAVMRSSYGGWVLNMGGPHGTPGLADESNIVKVRPARRENPTRFPARRGKYKILTVPEQHQLKIAKQTLRMNDVMARVMGGMTKDEARAIISRYLGPAAVDYFDAPERENPPRDLNSRQVAAARDALERYFGVAEIGALSSEGLGVLSSDLVELAEDEQLDYEQAAYTLRQRIGGPKNLDSYVAVLVAGARRRGNPPPPTQPRFMDRATAEVFYTWLQTLPIDQQHEAEQDVYAALLEQPKLYDRAGWPAIRARGEWLRAHRVPNPDPSERAHRSAEEQAAAFALRTLNELEASQQSLDRLWAQLQPKLVRGEKLTPQEIDALDFERKVLSDAQLAVRRAVAHHAAVIEEFHVEPRRENPPRAARAGAGLYREFHGRGPQNVTKMEIPDLGTLVHLGRALEIHYRAAVPRGRTNTPYRHEFGKGSQLYAPPGGGALVILGPITVSRSPRGRFGYIRG